MLSTCKPLQSNGEFPFDWLRISMDAESKGKGLRFDATINAGHILTFVGFLVTGIVCWSSLDKRVVVLEEQAKYQIAHAQQQDQALQDAKVHFEHAQERTDAKLDRILDKLSK